MTESAGPAVRTDLVEVYIFRRTADDPEFLQLQRAFSPQRGAWHPVMGHVVRGETAVAAARRECAEETGLSWSNGEALGFWQLEQVNPFYVAEHDAVYLSPRFAVEVEVSWKPLLNREHTDSRWVAARAAGDAFVWPGQRLACREVLREIVGADRYARLD